MTNVPVYEWEFSDGQPFGCGTECEFSYWQQEGIVDPEARLGKIISHEPQSEDERRKAMWGLANFHDKVAA